jgi:hypothetical protein
MTWKLKAQRAAFALVIVGTLGLAAGAGWLEGLAAFIFGWLE